MKNLLINTRLLFFTALVFFGEKIKHGANPWNKIRWILNFKFQQKFSSYILITKTFRYFWRFRKNGPQKTRDVQIWNLRSTGMNGSQKKTHTWRDPLLSVGRNLGKTTWKKDICHIYVYICVYIHMLYIYNTVNSGMNHPLVQDFWTIKSIYNSHQKRGLTMWHKIYWSFLLLNTGDS